jgi:hypothetical protein
VQDIGGFVILNPGNEQGTSREMFAVGIEGLVDNLEVRVLQFVYQRQKRDLTGVGDGQHRTATRHFAGQGGRIVHGSHARFEDRRINHPDSPHIEEQAE